MKDISILHLSDLHINRNNISDIDIVIDALLNDLKRMTDEIDNPIDLICFTGDLIQSGTMAHDSFDFAIEKFIIPLTDQVDVSMDKFLFVPGNHEINNSKLPIEETELGRAKLLINRDEVNKYIDHFNISNFEQLTHIEAFLDSINANTIWKDSLARSYFYNIKNVDIGIACLNTIWRSSSDSTKDQGRLLLGERQVDNAYKPISKCKLKIALMHHPIDWLQPHDKEATKKPLSYFDIVLNGHTHNLDEKQIILPDGNTIWCTCGSLFKKRSTYNGYSLITINPFTKRTTIYMREYMDSRRKFVPAERISDNGIKTFDLNNMEDSTALSYRIVEGLKNSFPKNINQTLLPAVIDNNNDVELKNIFVEPNLKKCSEYRKEEFPDKSENLNEIITEDENIMFIGKPELGKTTLLNYIALYYTENFYRYHKVPFVINVDHLSKGKNPIERRILDFVLDNTNTKQFTEKNIIKLLDAGYCIVLFDNIEFNDIELIKSIQSFTTKYPNNKYYFILNENIFYTITEDDYPDFGVNYSKIYIHTLNRKSIRQMIMNWFDEKQVDIDRLLSKIMYHLTLVGLPRTPLIICMMMSIYSQKNDFVPIQETSVMEGFMENILDKKSKQETKIGVYDFYNKERFLEHLAWEMVKRDKYELNYEEFMEFTINYHTQKGYKLKESRFDTIFFEKGILVIHNNYVYFRFKSIAEYYIAKMAVNDNIVLQHISDPENYLNFINELAYVTGIKRNQSALVNTIRTRILELLGPYMDVLKKLDNYVIEIINVNVKSLEERLIQHQLSEEQKDQIFDYPDKHSSFENQKMEKNKVNKNELYYALQLYGRMIRNSEDFDLQDKTSGISLYMVGCCLFVATIKSVIEDIELEDIDNLELDQNELTIVKDIMKITVPIVTQNFIAETIGSGKLDIILNNLIKNEDNEFIKFMYVFVYTDLKLSDSLIVLSNYVDSLNNKDLMTLSLFKLIYYYQLSYFGFVNNQQLSDLIWKIASKKDNYANRDREAVIESYVNPKQASSRRFKNQIRKYAK